ncbi:MULTISPECIES: hypothetical protein [Bacillus cereus group]|uniref:hypothetical protein n=1 Tax=Bacillus cereus group TaxID=86661 RepID=UPI001F2ADFB2|nr:MULTISPECIES: hypothetical protein [Bacillus cereus group]MDA2127891.1 hypothetical protein [Bacillus cereus]MEB8551239.1 hypothetical protein [Bacillus cereus]MEB8727622.1 hypothetical protein [Bacillus cereus]
MKETLIRNLGEWYAIRSNQEWRIRSKKQGGCTAVALKKLERELDEQNKFIKQEEDKLFEIMREERAI